jgi:hypothetical protein
LDIRRIIESIESLLADTEANEDFLRGPDSGKDGPDDQQRDREPSNVLTELELDEGSLGNLEALSPAMLGLFRSGGSRRQNKIEAPMGRDSPIEDFRLADSKDLIKDVFGQKHGSVGIVVQIGERQVVGFKRTSGNKSSEQASWSKARDRAWWDANKEHLPKSLAWIHDDYSRQIFGAKRVGEALLALRDYARTLNQNIRVMAVYPDTNRAEINKKRKVDKAGMIPRRRARAKEFFANTHDDAYGPLNHQDEPDQPFKAKVRNVEFDVHAGQWDYIKQLRSQFRDRLVKFKQARAGNYESDADLLRAFMGSKLGERFAVGDAIYVIDDARFQNVPYAMGLVKTRPSFSVDMYVQYKLENEWNGENSIYDKLRKKRQELIDSGMSADEASDMIGAMRPPRTIKFHFEARGGSLVPSRVEREQS